ncbi:mucin-5AC [Pogonomyrmex barbatus]|uniref:Mucin-5AC n=1 Tax=Pogonomyrmex barbatus TaxID=144034 RepID=A0A6I9WL61_9HYME|nr:mucin-5AC [Pogonomyrmex barbatus]
MNYEDGMPAGGNNRIRDYYPARMSERQQLALLLQITSQEVPGGSRSDNTSTTNIPSKSSSLQQQRNPKNRWSNKNGESFIQTTINHKEDFRVQQILMSGYNINASREINETDIVETAGPSEESITSTLNSPRSPEIGIVTATAAAVPPSPPSSPPLSPPPSLGQGSMETSSKMPVNASSVNPSTASGTGNASSSTESGDIYEFKSSKEPTPVRGASSSPNPNLDKDKDGGGKPSGPNGQGNQSGGSSASTIGNSLTSINEATIAPLVSSDETLSVPTSSPSSKRIYEGDNTEEQDEENRRKKRKDSENAKESTKNNPTGRQSTGRNAANSGEKCIKSGKQGSGTVTGKGNQNTNSVNADRKSPSTSSMASSPKPLNISSSTITKTGTPLPESDGEEDRSKCSDSNSAPKVPPLKIVIPQSTASEQEQGNRNGKNVANRSHQLPYVVASSNSNDSTEKEQSQLTSGTTSPTEGSIGVKGEDKKDFSGTLHGEERAMHHQRVLRSSHRTGNGNNGSTMPKEAIPLTGNGGYSNLSPLPANATIDRSNNSSPQQRHHSPTPETIGSDVSKTTSSESTITGAISKCNTTTEKPDKNTDVAGKNQKDNNAENLENISSTTSSTISNVNTPAPPVELHPRKRKMKPSKEAQQAAATAAANETVETTSTGPEIHPHDQPITNCYQLFLNIRKQIERRRKGLFPVQPKPPQGFKDYLMNHEV